MRSLIAVMFLTGCAYFSPQRMVAGLDTTSPKYATPECAQARQQALDYDDRFAERAAMGAGAGRAGPVGLGAAIAIDQEQARRREDVKSEVSKRCM
jgi:hypothetical protein